MTKDINAKFMRVKGRFLYDSSGEKVVIRGVENFFEVNMHGNGDIIQEIAKTGANCLRILFRYDPIKDKIDLGPEGLENLIKLTLTHGMIPDMCLVSGNNLTSADRIKGYLNADVKRLILKYEEFSLLQAHAETREDSDEAWAASSKKIIDTFRGAGYSAPLYILARTEGRHLPCIFNKAEEVLKHDPLKNCVFGWQAYWGESGYYDKLYGMSLHDAVLRLKDVNFMVQLGVDYFADKFKRADGTEVIDIMDYKDVMKLSHENDISWLWWDWHFPKVPQNNLTRDGKFGNWQEPFGAEVCINSPYGLKNTSSVKQIFSKQNKE